MMASRAVLILLVAVVATTSAAQMGCMDEEGKPVDWFVALKLPKHTQPVSDGYTYTYVDTNTESDGLKQSAKSLSSTNDGAVAHTLLQVYANTTAVGGYLAYNDEHPKRPSTLGKSMTMIGHSKGFVAFNKDGGFWLIHSAPKFPDQVGSKYTGLPVGESLYGQSFLCLTLDPKEIETVSSLFVLSDPSIYSKYIDSALAGSFPQFEGILNHQVNLKEPSSNVTSITTRGGKQMTAFFKNAVWDKKLYSELVAPTLKEDLMVETWCRPCMPSECRPKVQYQTINIETMSIAGHTYKVGDDHSKWAISASAGTNTVCIGDINRMVSQETRAGGTVCFNSAAVWKQLSAAVQTTDKCPSEEYRHFRATHGVSWI